MNVEAQVLAHLSENNYCSGEAISNDLNMTRSAVWKHIVKLRERGYVIDALPRQGYLLRSRPDKLLPNEIYPRLKTLSFGQTIVHLERTESTTKVARELVEAGTPDGTVVIAEAQTQGRGRMGRSWQTPAGKSIAMSLIIYPEALPAMISLGSLAAALAVRSAIVRVIGEEAAREHNLQLKWPNDIYLNGKKICGILLEISAELDRVKWAIISIGLNVNNIFKTAEMRERATSLRTELGTRLSRRDIAVALIESIEQMYLRFRTENGPEGIRHEFELHDMLQGGKTVLVCAEGTVCGTAVGIDTDGRLLLRTADGKQKAFFSGEASLSQGEPSACAS